MSTAFIPLVDPVELTVKLSIFGATVKKSSFEDEVEGPTTN
jgi:hypothetical protein